MVDKSLFTLEEGHSVLTAIMYMYILKWELKSTDLKH
jgi:hypothetical protein